MVNAYQSIVNYAHTHSHQNHGGTDGNDNSMYPSGIRKRPIGKHSLVDLQHTNQTVILGTASSDGSVRSMATSASGPPLAPSFLSSLSSTPPITLPPPNPPPPAVPASSAHYTRRELANVHFVHSLALLGHVVCSKQARPILFPLIIINHEKQGENFLMQWNHFSLDQFSFFPVHVKDILRVIIQIMFTGNYGSKSQSCGHEIILRVCRSPSRKCFTSLLSIIEKTLFGIGYMWIINV